MLGLHKRRSQGKMRGWILWFACILINHNEDVAAFNSKAKIMSPLLSNIRSHLAEQVVEQDSGLISIDLPKDKGASLDVDSHDEIPSAPKKISKSTIKVNPEDDVQNMIANAKCKSNIGDEDGDQENDKYDGEDLKGMSKSKTVKETKRSTQKKIHNTTDEVISFPKGLPVFALTSSAVKSELCRKHSQLYLQQLERYKMWAILMYDASAKFPSGVLQGNVNQFGDFDECLKAETLLKDETQEKSDNIIQGRYCLAFIDIEGVAEEGDLPEAASRAEAYGATRNKAKDPGYFFPHFTTIKWGLCVPSSCSSIDVEKALKEELSKYNDKAGVSLNVVVEEDACVDRKDLNFSISAGAILTMIFYLAVITTSVYATYCDDAGTKQKKQETEEIKQKNHEDDEKSDKMEAQGDEVLKRKGDEEEDKAEAKEEITELNKFQRKLQRLLMAFSLKRTTSELLRANTDDEITCIHGIKAIFMVVLYVTHKLMMLASTPHHNRTYLTELTNSGGSAIFRGGTTYTDGFLLISGLLLSFNLTREIMNRGRVSWVRRFIGRVIRLTPPLLAVILFYAYISELLGSGPQWGLLVGRNALICRENAWANLLYIQNFFDFQNMCVPQTYHLAIDMQLSLTAPILVYILHHYDLVGLSILQAICLISSTLRYIVTSDNELTMAIYHGISHSKAYESFNTLYAQSIYRATPYVLGVTVGYYLRKHGSFLQERLQRSPAPIGWIVASCLAFSTIVTPAYMADRAYVYNVQEAAQYAALTPIAWSIALGWLIAACYLGYGGRLNDFLSCRPLLILSRLSYSIYLIQFLVFNHNTAISRAPKYFSVVQGLDFGEICITLMLSFLVTILFDIPMQEIKSVLMEGSLASVKELKKTIKKT